MCAKVRQADIMLEEAQREAGKPGAELSSKHAHFACRVRCILPLPRRLEEALGLKRAEEDGQRFSSFALLIIGSWGMRIEAPTRARMLLLLCTMAHTDGTPFEAVRSRRMWFRLPNC